jgi:hypothetical protein
MGLDGDPVLDDLSDEEMKERIFLLSLATKKEVESVLKDFKADSLVKSFLESVSDTRCFSDAEAEAMLGLDFEDMDMDGIRGSINDQILHLGLNVGMDDEKCWLRSGRVMVVMDGEGDFDEVSAGVQRIYDQAKKKNGSNMKLLKALIGRKYGVKISDLEAEFPDYRLGVEKLITNTNWWNLKDEGYEILIRNGLAVLAPLHEPLKIGASSDLRPTGERLSSTAVKAVVLANMRAIVGSHPLFTQFLSNVCADLSDMGREWDYYDDLKSQYRGIDALITKINEGPLGSQFRLQLVLRLDPTDPDDMLVMVVPLTA